MNKKSEKIKNNKLRIPNIEARCLFHVVNGEVEPSGFSFLYKKDGQTLRKWGQYSAVFDESMINDKLSKVIDEGHSGVKKSEAYFSKYNSDGMKHTNQIIQLKYNIHLFDETAQEREERIEHNAKVKRGIDPSTDKPTDEELEETPTPPIIMDTKELRLKTYQDGFTIDGIEYVRWMRSSGSAREGKVLFINKKLQHIMNLFTDAKIDTSKPLDIAAFEAYRSLMLSTKIGEIEIKPENILLIQDYVSTFKDKCIVTSINKKNKLSTDNKNKVEVTNVIWDGQSLIDPSLMGEYKSKGMILLRNQMFKSCCFNCNIQKWMKDKKMTMKRIRELIADGKIATTATKIEDIKFITTPSSIKFKKFGQDDTWYEDWLSLVVKKTNCRFGVVKYEKPQKHGGGTQTRTHYQLMNTLQMTDEQLEKVMKPTVRLMKNLAQDPAKMQEFCGYYCDDEEEHFHALKQTMYWLLSHVPEIANTEWYETYAKRIIEEVRRDVKRGRLFVKGNYSTLCGNPIEMLQAAVGRFDGTSVIKPGTVVSTRFKDGERLLVCRSPHVTMGNIYLPENRHNKKVRDYMNLTKEILIINSINENTFQRLQGADLDSDAALVTNDKILVRTAKENYKKFKIPYNNVKSELVLREYTAENLAELDHTIANNLIGKIINESQKLNSIYWQSLEEKHSDCEEIYKDICTLSVMSGVEIDRAKKVVAYNAEDELKKIEEKYANYPFPTFFKVIEAEKVQKNTRKAIRKKHADYSCTMNALYYYIKGKNFPIKKVEEQKDWKEICKVKAKDLTEKQKAKAEELLKICKNRHTQGDIAKDEDQKNVAYKRFEYDFKQMCHKQISPKVILHCLNTWKEANKEADKEANKEADKEANKEADKEATYIKYLFEGLVRYQPDSLLKMFKE